MSIALMFPGQGSQQVSMGRFLCDEFKQAKEVFEEASDAISIDLKKLCFEDVDKQLNLTMYTQPAILTVSVATYRTISENFSLPVSFGAGHSVGEYPALVSAGAISLADGARLVYERGKAMQEAVPVGEGAMTAIMGLEPSLVEKLCDWVKQESGLKNAPEPANFNSNQQTVVSGSVESLKWMKDNYAPEVLGVSQKVKFIPLKVSAPFHCSMMQPAEEKMKTLIDETHVSDSKWPVIQNTLARPAESVEGLKKALTEQITSSVRWVQSMEYIGRQEPSAYIECGSGKVLVGLLKKINPDVENAFNLNSIDDLKLLETFLSR